MRTDLSMSVMPAQFQEAMVDIGRHWRDDIQTSAEKVRKAYAPLLAQGPRGNVAQLRDVAYGKHSRQVLDIFMPAGAEGAPVIVFVHGGAFVRGDKSSPGGMYDNVLHWFARQGFVGINLEYRLAPESKFPGATEDVAAGMQWVHDHVAAHGGDPARIMLVGHSAGGTHAASYCFDPNLGWLGRHTRALVLISARLTADVLDENPNAPHVKSYYGDDAQAHLTGSPMGHAAHGKVPTFIVTAEYDNPLLDIYGLEFAWRLAAQRRRAPRFLQMMKHNHISIVAHFNTPEEQLGREILDFFEQTEREG